MLTWQKHVTRQDQLPFSRRPKSIQDITHLHQVRVGLLAVEPLLNWAVPDTVDVRLSDILLVLHPGNDLKIRLLWWHSYVLGNRIKSLLVIELDMVTDRSLQRTSL